MGDYQRLRDNNNAYPGNSTTTPPAYPQIDYASARSSQGTYVNNPSYQPQPQPQQQYAQPSPYGQQPQQGTYTTVPQYNTYQSQPMYGVPQDGQPIYNVYGGQQYQPVQDATVYSYAQPITVAQPGVPGHLVRGIWSDNIFDCFDSVSTCLMACLFPCIRWAQTIHRASLMSFWGALFLYTIPALACFAISVYFNYLSSTGENIYLGASKYYTKNASLLIPLYCVMIVTHLFVVLLGTMFRQKIREKYQIPGSGCEDCLLHWCCSCCAIAQEARHVDRDLALAI